ncbi:MAG: hypothetical protein ACJ79H_19485 [Myxococcales bacterium]
MAGILALAAIGLCRIGYFQLAVERHRAPAARIDDRYRAVRALLPAAGEVGYVSDRRVARRPGEYETSPGTRMYVEAQYALAPLVLRVDDDRAALVVANVADAGALLELLAQRNLRIVARAAPGVALARPAVP